MAKKGDKINNFCHRNEGKKMTMALESVKIRLLKREDLDAILEIDEKVLEEHRRDYWERKLETRNGKASQASFVAEVDGKVAGFILGDVSGWEFGVPDTIGIGHRPGP